MRTSLLLAASLLISPLQATTWQLSPEQSQVSFTTIKKEHIAENHTFGNIDATLNQDGTFSFSIDLDSVNTAIPIRDERMKEHLFNTKSFAKATFTAKVDAGAVKSLATGESTKLSISGNLSLHGQTQPVTATVMVSKLKNDKLLVNSLAPMLVRAGDFNLVAGVNKLKELAGLPSIGETVPVSFVLTLVQK